MSFLYMQTYNLESFSTLVTIRLKNPSDAQFVKFTILEKTQDGITGFNVQLQGCYETRRLFLFLRGNHLNVKHRQYCELSESI